MATHTSLKSSRIETRVSDFVVAHVEVAAKKVIEEHARLHLDQAQSQKLVEALLSAKKPNKKLKLAMGNYRRRVESR